MPDPTEASLLAMGFRSRVVSALRAVPRPQCHRWTGVSVARLIATGTALLRPPLSSTRTDAHSTHLT